MQGREEDENPRIILPEHNTSDNVKLIQKGESKLL